MVASGSYDTTVRFWDIKSSARKEIMVLKDAKDAVMSIDVRGWEVVAGSVDGRVRSYDIRMGRCTVDTICAEGVTSVKLTRDGRGLLVGGLDGVVRVVDRGSGGVLGSYKGGGSRELRVGVCWAEEEGVVVSGSEEGGVWCWDVVSGECRVVLRGHGKDGRGRGVVSCVAEKKGGGEMVSGGSDGGVVVWGV